MTLMRNDRLSNFIIILWHQWLILIELFEHNGWIESFRTKCFPIFGPLENASDKWEIVD